MTTCSRYGTVFCPLSNGVSSTSRRRARSSSGSIWRSTREPCCVACGSSTTPTSASSLSRSDDRHLNCVYSATTTRSCIPSATETRSSLCTTRTCARRSVCDPHSRHSLLRQNATGTLHPNRARTLWISDSVRRDTPHMSDVLLGVDKQSNPA